MREIHETSKSEAEEHMKVEAGLAQAPLVFDLLLLSLAVYFGLIVYWLWGAWQHLFVSVGFQSFFVYPLYRRRRWARLTLTIIHGLGCGFCALGELFRVHLFLARFLAGGLALLLIDQASGQAMVRGAR